MQITIYQDPQKQFTIKRFLMLREFVIREVPVFHCISAELLWHIDSCRLC